MISCVEGIEHGERQLAEVSTRHSEVKRGRERSEAGSRRSENRRELGIGIGECGFKGEELGVRIQESGEKERILEWSIFFLCMKYFLHNKITIAIFPYFFLK